MSIWVGTRAGGDLVDDAEATVSVLDHGFTVADGVFETLKATPAGAFALTRHLRRLRESACALRLPEPDPSVISAAVADVLKDAELGSDELGRLRITYTAGPGPLGSDRGQAEPTLVVALTRTQPWPETTSLATMPWTRNERSAVAGVKSTSYAENVVALARAHELGASEAILANTAGELCEGTGSNVFLVLEGRVATPPLSSGCLAGITRELVLEWFDVEERVLEYEALFEADEVLITSSTRDVHPVVRVDGRAWQGPGPVGAQLRKGFMERASRDIDP